MCWKSKLLFAAVLCGCGSRISVDGGGHAGGAGGAPAAAAGGASLGGAGASGGASPGEVRWTRTFDGALHVRDVAFGVDAGPSGVIGLHGLEGLSAAGAAVRTWLVLLSPDGETLHEEHANDLIGWDVALSETTLLAAAHGVIEPATPGVSLQWLALADFSETGDAWPQSGFESMRVDYGGATTFAVAVHADDATELELRDAAGDKLWWMTLPGIGLGGVALSGDDHVVFAGRKPESYGAEASVLMAFSGGVPLWTIHDEPAMGRPTGIDLRADGSRFYVSSIHYEPAGAGISAHDASGAVLWEDLYVSQVGWVVESRSVATSPDGTVVLAGTYQNGGAFLRKYTESGELVWHRDVMFFPDDQSPFEMWDMAVGPSADIYLAGSLRSEDTEQDMVIMALAP